MNFSETQPQSNDSHWNDDAARLPFATACRWIFVALETVQRQTWSGQRRFPIWQSFATDALPRNQRAKLTYRPTDKSSLKATVSSSFLARAKVDRVETVRRNDKRRFYDRRAAGKLISASVWFSTKSHTARESCTHMISNQRISARKNYYSHSCFKQMIWKLI